MSEPSASSKVRLLGEVGTSDKPASPDARQGPGAIGCAAGVDRAAGPRPRLHAEPIFLGDSADGADLLNAGQIVQPLAQLCVTPQVQTPFLAAILGPSGAGKTFALRRLAQAIEQLSASPATAAGTRFGAWSLARVDASTGVEAPVAIASAAYAALDREPGGVDYTGLLDEIGHAGGDPHRAARAASDRHDDLVTKLEAERSQRDDIEAKRARLADTLAFDTPRLAHRCLRPRPQGNDRGAVAPVRARRRGFRLELPQSGARHIDARRGRPRRSGRSVDMGLWQPGSPASVGNRRLRAGLHPPISARRNGDLRDWAGERLVEAGRGLGGGARRLVRSSGADPVHPWRLGHRAQPLARASVLEPSVARRTTAQQRGPRTPQRPGRTRRAAQSARGRPDRRG